MMKKLIPLLLVCALTTQAAIAGRVTRFTSLMRSDSIDRLISQLSGGRYSIQDAAKLSPEDKKAFLKVVTRSNPGESLTERILNTVKNNDVELSPQDRATILNFFESAEGSVAPAEDIQGEFAYVVNVERRTLYRSIMTNLLDTPFSEIQAAGFSSLLPENFGKMIYESERGHKFRQELYDFANYLDSKITASASPDVASMYQNQIPSLVFDETELGQAVLDNNPEKFFHVWQKLVDEGTLKDVLAHTNATMTKKTAESVQRFIQKYKDDQHKSFVQMKTQLIEMNDFFPASFRQEMIQVENMLKESDSWSVWRAMNGMFAGTLVGVAGGSAMGYYLESPWGFVPLIGLPIAGIFAGAYFAQHDSLISKAESMRRKKIVQLREEGIQVELRNEQANLGTILSQTSFIREQDKVRSTRKKYIIGGVIGFLLGALIF